LKLRFVIFKYNIEANIYAKYSQQGTNMLELRPTCEHCNASLSPDSLEARICSFECTFCANCVETVLKANACPNCGGGFVQRPVRTSQDWKNGNFLGNDPASKTLKHRPVDLVAYAKLVAQINGLPPEKR
jgi:uncharacterized protein